MDRYYDHVCNEYKKVKCVATNLLLLMLCFRVRFDLLYFIIKAFPHLFLIHFKICVDNRCEKKMNEHLIEGAAENGLKRNLHLSRPH